MTMTMKANAQIQALTSALVHITNMHKIYGAKSPDTKTSEISNTTYIADILLQSLETIRALQKERDDLIDSINSVLKFDKKDNSMVADQVSEISLEAYKAYCDFILNQIIECKPEIRNNKNSILR